MKRQIILLFLFIASFQAYAYEFSDWLAHCNFSLGVNAVIGGDVIDKGDEYLVRLPAYIFHFDPDSDIKTLPVNFGLSLRIPVCFTDAFAAGLLANVGGTISFMLGIYGAYFEYYYKDGWSFLAGFGVSGAYLNTDVGRMPSDTGGSYANDRISVMGSSFSGPGFVLGAKYHIYEYLFLEAGYGLVWEQHIKNADLAIGSKLVPLRGEFDSIDLRTAHSLFIKIGVGM
jgi:hypothetical protein